MAADDVQTTQTPPLSNRRDRSRSTRLLTSWKIWLPLVLVELGVITAALGIPVYRRMQAIRYLEAHSCPVEFTRDSEWLTERLGDFGIALRPIEHISCRVEFSDEVLIRVALLSDVRHLECEGYRREPLTQKGLDALRSLSELEGIYMEGIREPNEMLLALLESQSPLRSVFVSNGRVSADTFAALSRRETITKLTLYAAAPRDEFRDIHPMPQLEELDLLLSGRIDMDWLLRSTQLRELELDCALSDDDLEQIALLSQLTSLNLVHLPKEHQVTEAGIAHLARLPNLRSIGLPEELLTQECIEVLRGLPNLKYLIASRYISDRAVREAASREWSLSEWGP